jgi:hypothetical protein
MWLGGLLLGREEMCELWDREGPEWRECCVSWRGAQEAVVGVGRCRLGVCTAESRWSRVPWVESSWLWRIYMNSPLSAPMYAHVCPCPSPRHHGTRD